MNEQGDAVAETEVESLRRWFRRLAERGWNPDGDNTGWTHDDNRMAQPYGFMLVQLPSKPYLELFGVGPWTTYKPTEVLSRIKRLSNLDPLCAKAISTMVKMAILHPNEALSYRECVSGK